MKSFLKFWVGAFILSMIVYYIPIYLFSNNLTQSVMSLKFEKAAPVAMINALPPGLNSDQVGEKLKQLAENAVNSGRFDTDTSLEDALKNNPSVKSVELLRGGTPADYVPAIDPVYHDLDVGLKITFQDGSGLIAIFDAIDKSFLGGHGAKVFHVQAGYRINPDGHMFLVQGEDAMTGLVLMIFAKDQSALPGLYNNVFGTKVPVGQIANTTPDGVEQSVANALNGSSTPVGASSNSPTSAPVAVQPQVTAAAPNATTPSPQTTVPVSPTISTQAAAQTLGGTPTPPASASTADTDLTTGVSNDWPTDTPCITKLRDAYVKDANAKSLDDSVSMDQANEWASTCKALGQ